MQEYVHTREFPSALTNEPEECIKMGEAFSYIARKDKAIIIKNLHPWIRRNVKPDCQMSFQRLKNRGGIGVIIYRQKEEQHGAVILQAVLTWEQYKELKRYVRENLPGGIVGVFRSPLDLED